MGKILIDTSEIPFSINQLYAIMPYATVFSDNMTNGDIIKALFPKKQFVSIASSRIYDFTTDNKIDCDLEWWNSPYKGE